MLLSLAALALCAMSCQQHPQSAQPPKHPLVVKTTSSVAGDPMKPVSVDEAVASDPCALRLHDISGALLMYYMLHREMPAKLDDLRSVQDIDQNLQFTCPASGLPYGYSPQGLSAPGRKKLILVHDSTPSHRGIRWCILAPSVKPGEAVSLEVLPLTEPVFLSYQPK